MKLVFCGYCWDVVKLVYDETRTCGCGKSGGRYLSGDGNRRTPHPDTGLIGTAEVWGKYAFPIAIANEDLKNMPYAIANSQTCNMLRCWVITPHAFDWQELIALDIPIYGGQSLSP